MIDKTRDATVQGRMDEDIDKVVEAKAKAKLRLVAVFGLIPLILLNTLL